MTTKAEYRGALRRMVEMNAAYKALNYDVTVQMQEILLTIATHPGITHKELSERTGLAQSSVSRNVHALTKWDRHGKPGMDLIEDVEDPIERRRKITFLTKNGKRFMARLVAIMIEVSPESVDVDSPLAQDHVDKTFRDRLGGDRT